MGKGADRGSGVGPDAREGEKILLGGWQSTLVELYDSLGGGMEPACAGVITEPLPCGEHLLLCCRGEVGKGRELCHPVVKTGGHRRDRGLLEHELGDEHGVGVMALTPGEVMSPVLGMPFQEHHAGYPDRNRSA